MISLSRQPNPLTCAIQVASDLIRERSRADLAEKQLQAKEEASIRADGELGEEMDSLKSELAVGWADARRAQTELDEHRVEMSGLSSELSTANEAIARLQEEFTHAATSLARRRKRRAMRGAWGALKVSERSLNPMLYSTLDCSFPKKHPFFIVLSTGSTRPVGHKGGAEGPASSSSATAVQHIPRNDHMEDFS